jgi:nucleoside-diphosphate-sugar epimerase
MTTFVTGGTSSIGRVLVKKYAQEGEPVRVLARKSSDLRGLSLPGVEFINGDVTDLQSVRGGMHGCDRVVHLAAIVGHQVAEETWWKVNCDGSRNVLQAALDLGIKSMVQVSSISTLGPTQIGEVADESRPVAIQNHYNLYQKTKHAADEIARGYAVKGLRVMIVYPCFGYGYSWASSHPSMQETTLLRMASDKPVAIFGSGQNRLTLSYYDDTVDGINLALLKGQSGEDYILGGDCLTFPQIWAEIASLLGKKPPRARIPLGLLKTVNGGYALLRGKPLFPSDFFDMVGYDWCFCSEKAKTQLGWQPKRFHDGIALTWAAYQHGNFQMV